MTSISKSMIGSHSGIKNKTQLTSRADFQLGTLWPEAMRTPLVNSMRFVVDVTTVSCRPWSALCPGKARPHPRLVDSLKLRPVSIQKFQKEEQLAFEVALSRRRS